MKNLSLLLFFLITLPLFAQIELPESTKMLIHTSIESDGNADIEVRSWDNWLVVRRNHFDYLKVVNTSTYYFYKPISLDSITNKYSIQLFKIYADNSEKQSRYLIQYKDFREAVWLRVAGYTENDIHLLFDYLRKQGIRKQKLRLMIQEWQRADELFKEIDLNCLFHGYLRHSTSGNCFKSVYYIGLNDLSIGCNILEADEINSVFSKVPLSGYLSKKPEPHYLKKIPKRPQQQRR